MEQVKKVTLRHLLRMKRRSEKIVWVVLYDWPTAMLADQAGIDMILVGDSVAMTMLGLPTTLPITMDIMLHHAQAVVRGVKRAFVVGDMPFMSYVTAEDAIKNAAEMAEIEGEPNVIYPRKKRPSIWEFFLEESMTKFFNFLSGKRLQAGYILSANSFKTPDMLDAGLIPA